MTELASSTISDLAELHLLSLDDAPTGMLDISDHQRLAESAELVVNGMAVIKDAATLHITEAGRTHAITAHNKRMVATVTDAVNQLMTNYTGKLSSKIETSDLYAELRFEIRPMDH